MTAVALKLGTQADVETIRHIAIQSYKQHYLYLWEEYKYAEWYMNRSFGIESLQQQMKDTKTVFYLIYHQQMPVGFVKLNYGKAAYGKDDNTAVELERIYILKEASGSGIGTAVVKQLLQGLQQQQKETLWLKSMDSSRSVNFYEKMDFVTVGKERLPFEGFVDAYRNMCIMTRPVAGI